MTQEICEECKNWTSGKCPKHGQNLLEMEKTIPQWPPMIDRQAVLCPVCKGEGNIHRGTHSTIGYNDFCCPCKGCGGKGWVVI